MRDHRKIFTEIYEKNVWGNGSGGGSTPENTLAYRGILQQFMKDMKIKTVVDFGCGDWSFSHLIDWRGIKYLGIDCVQKVIEGNWRYANEYAMYRKGDLTFMEEDEVYKDRMDGDLLILKDVFQHWTEDEVGVFLLDVTPHFKYILITNTVGPSAEGFISLAAGKPPLSKYNPKVLAYLHTSEIKEVSLITRP